MQLVMRWLVVVATAAALAICLLALAPLGTEAAEAAAAAAEIKEQGFGVFKLPKLFDFDYYKQKYGKTYKSLQESLARKAYFMARALRAYVSGMNFKWRRSPYFLAINHLSDSSPQERESRQNKVLMEMSEAAREGNKSPAQVPDELPEFLPAQGENVEAELLRLAEANREKPGYRELLEAPNATKGRRKREVSKPQMPREFSLDQLMQPGVHEPIREREAVAAKMANNVPSNNPFYQQPEIATHGLWDNHEEINGWVIEDTRPIGSQLKSSLDGLSQGVYLSKNNGDDGQDRMYFDHRDSDCLTTPRNQGNCGSCYAFSTTALMEWVYCMKTDWVVPFTEQYIIDCGRGHYGNKLKGCDGGFEYETFKFVQNFGLERLKAYPYTQREGQCPYNEEQSIKETGYIRMEFDDAAIVPVSLWNEYIEYSPLHFGIASPADFEEYSGGVHDGKNCAEMADHAVLLVGHGREDGKDFWLVRNSYGPNWGEGGYFKLSKDAPERCIFYQAGYSIGAKDGKEINFMPRKNAMNKRLEPKQA